MKIPAGFKTRQGLFLTIYHQSITILAIPLSNAVS